MAGIHVGNDGGCLFFSQKLNVLYCVVFFDCICYAFHSPLLFFSPSGLSFFSPLSLSPFLLSLPFTHVHFSFRTSEVILTNFVLSKHLVRDEDELADQRGSLAYVSPDVLSGEF